MGSIESTSCKKRSILSTGRTHARGDYCGCLLARRTILPTTWRRWRRTQPLLLPAPDRRSKKTRRGGGRINSPTRFASPSPKGEEFDKQYDTQPRPHSRFFLLCLFSFEIDLSPYNPPSTHPTHTLPFTSNPSLPSTNPQPTHRPQPFTKYSTSPTHPSNHPLPNPPHT